MKKILIGTIVIISVLGMTGCTFSGGDSDSTGVIVVNKPLNLSVFVDLSDRILQKSDNMLQEEKDKTILKDLASKFYSKNEKKFAKSEDVFQIVFYPAPCGAQSFAHKLSLDLSRLTSIPEKRIALLNFKGNLSDGVDSLYESATKADNFFGSDIWGYFAKDKVSDLYKNNFRNVLVILTDGYIYDAKNKLKEGNNYSYILPSKLASGSGLIPCKISHPDIEVYVIECNANPRTDFTKMKVVISNWMKGMGIDKVDIQDTDIPTNTLKHLTKEIFG